MAQATPTTTPASARQNPILIRPALPPDAPAIAALGAHVFSATFGHSVSPDELSAYLSKEYTPASITSDLQNPAKDTFVAVRNNASNNADNNDAKILGFATLTQGTSEPCVDALESKVELQRIYVDTGAQGRGVGGMLARRAEWVARERGFEHVWLGVWEENAGAQRAYERWGYGKVGQHDFVIGTVVQTDWIMVKKL
ncbi:putative acyl- n-acyltransferase [Diplodia seriata]|uniref:Putative acyl-n-acyltransferase n=1 Tax=Diplodia seriata TaxID=420778 RepID=A0A0G2DXW4_9PEZI|nr:putative acyl- n-acyltransferase [Diplodia seriata]